MKSHSKLLINFLVVLALLVSMFSTAAFASPARAADAARDAGLPVAQLLNPDGTLDFTTGYSGPLDIANYGVSLDPARGPVFKPLAVPIGWGALNASNTLNGVVNAIGVDSFGAVILGGLFTDANLPVLFSQNADFIAQGCNVLCQEMGTTPFDASVNAIVVSGTDAYVGGAFTNAGGNPSADKIAKWNGSAWSALGFGFSIGSTVNAIAVSGGDVYAGGNISALGNGPLVNGIAKFSGGTWSTLGVGLSIGSIVNAIAISGTDVYAGGTFLNAGGDPNADKIAKFSGGVWSALGSMPLNNTVNAIASNGLDVYVGGAFTDAGGDLNADKIAKFSGGAWSALGSTPLNGGVNAIAISSSGIVYAGGSFTDAGGVAIADYIARFNGSSWSALEDTVPLNNTVKAIFISNDGFVYAGGSFTDANGTANADFIAKFDTSNTWDALGSGPGTTVSAIAISGSDVYAGGAFTNAGGVAEADYIAKFNGSTWSALGNNGAGVGALSTTVSAIAISGSDVYAGGAFLNAGGVAEADYIAKFNGSTWSALGNNGAGVGALSSIVFAIAISGTDVYAGGSFLNAGGVAEADYIAKFNGSTWSALGNNGAGIGALSTTVSTIAISGTDVYAGGSFTDAGGVAAADFIAKFNGSTWSALGATPLNAGVNAIAISGSDVYAGGGFTDAGLVANADFIAKFNSGSWSSLGTTPLSASVFAIAISGSDVYAGGNFLNAGGVAEADYIAKFNGATWSSLGKTPLSAGVLDIAINAGNLYTGGAFLDAGGDVNADNIAKFEIPHPTVSSITRVNPTPTSAASVNFTVTFSESVTGVDIGDFSLTTSDVTSATVSGFSGTGSAYTVTVNTGTGNGAIRLNVVDDNSIVGDGSNPLGGAAVSDGNFTAGEIYTVNKNKSLIIKSIAANDGWILESTETSNVGGTLNATATTFNLGDGAADKQYRALLHFDTSSVEDNATITKVTLKIKKQGLVGTDPFTVLGGLRVDMRKPSFGTTIGLVIGDFQAAAGRSTVATFGVTPVLNWYSAVLNGPGKAYVNKTGTTQFRLLFATDDNDDSGADYMKFFSGNAPAATRPQLIIEYTVP